VALGLLDARDAHACSINPPPPALVGMPANGETGVPTDVRLVYDSFKSGISASAGGGTFELTTASGDTVAVELQHRLWSHVELVPARELAPLTTYTLKGRWTASAPGGSDASGTVSFTTGAGPVSGAPAAPVASMRHYRLHGGESTSCDLPPVGTCVALPVGQLVQVTYLDDVGQEIGVPSESGSPPQFGSLAGGPFFDDLAGIDQGTNFECVVLRTRAANGRLSPPTVVCGDDAPLYELRGRPDIACTPEGLTHAGELVLASEPTGGCSVAPDRAPSPALLAPLLVALGAAARRRASGKAK
jgi:MYXO-CTERM domain-containing protein